MCIRDSFFGRVKKGSPIDIAILVCAAALIIALLAILVMSLPVSYTHLDVYKRQMQAYGTDAIRRHLDLDVLSYYDLSAPKSVTFVCGVPRVFAASDDISSVSYTHLDVYKRQVQDLGAHPARDSHRPSGASEPWLPPGRCIPCLLYTSRCV